VGRGLSEPPTSGVKAMPLAGEKRASAQVGLIFSSIGAYLWLPTIEFLLTRRKVLLEMSAAMNAGINRPGFYWGTRLAFQVGGEDFSAQGARRKTAVNPRTSEEL